MACNCITTSQLYRLPPTPGVTSSTHVSSSPRHCRRLSFSNNNNDNCLIGSTSYTLVVDTSMRITVPTATSSISSITQDDDDDGVSLGTMKLPADTDIPRFETLLFQWANSLCQGANLPLPVPLKIDKICGGVRLGFITIGDGDTEVLVHIDCLVYPPSDESIPIFRAARNGPMKDKSPPGEARIMKSLLAALKKSVEIARL